MSARRFAGETKSTITWLITMSAEAGTGERAAGKRTKTGAKRRKRVIGRHKSFDHPEPRKGAGVNYPTLARGTLWPLARWHRPALHATPVISKSLN